MSPLKAIAVTILTGLAASSTSFALPVLQLDISGGTYDAITQTVVTQADQFTVYALLDTKQGSLTDIYSLSMAVTPEIAQSVDAGFFTIDNQKIAVTADMSYGTPTNSKGTSLPPHDIFPTYYTEKSFSFSSTNIANEYNVQDNPGSFATATTPGLYYQAFTFDVSNLKSGYELHFDLYNETNYDIKGNAAKVIKFAPFSHDAGTTGTTNVPEPATLSLLSVALLGLGLIRRK